VRSPFPPRADPGHDLRGENPPPPPAFGYSSSAACSNFLWFAEKFGPAFVCPSWYAIPFFTAVVPPPTLSQTLGSPIFLSVFLPPYFPFYPPRPTSPPPRVHIFGSLFHPSPPCWKFFFYLLLFGSGQGLVYFFY